MAASSGLYDSLLTCLSPYGQVLTITLGWLLASCSLASAFASLVFVSNLCHMWHTLFSLNEVLFLHTLLTCAENRCSNTETYVSDIADVQTNLVPYPRVYITLSS